MTILNSGVLPLRMLRVGFEAGMSEEVYLFSFDRSKVDIGN